MRRRFYTILRGGNKSLIRVAENTEMVPLQASGTTPAFFIIDSFPYFIEVVKLFSRDQSVMSLIGHEEMVMAGRYSIAEEAARHVRTILKYQPSGPYMLGGCSASGIVAYETAQQLRAQGREIGLLVLFDTPNPYYMREYSAIRMSLNSYREDLHRLQVHEIPRWVGMKFKALVSREATRLQCVLLGTGKKLEPLEIRIRAARKYRPAPYLGKVLLFRRHRELVGRYLDPEFGWNGVVRGDFEVCRVDATDHLEIFKTEIDRAVVARKLNQYFKKSIKLNDFIRDGNPSHGREDRTG
jgi:thioesterase domain-containing protein